MGIGVIANLHLNQNDSVQTLKKEADEQIKYILTNTEKKLNQ